MSRTHRDVKRAQRRRMWQRIIGDQRIDRFNRAILYAQYEREVEKAGLAYWGWGGYLPRRMQRDYRRKVRHKVKDALKTRQLHRLFRGFDGKYRLAGW